MKEGAEISAFEQKVNASAALDLSNGQAHLDRLAVRGRSSAIPAPCVDGDMVYVSGTTGYDYATMKMPEDAGEQARNALATIDKALQEAGSSLKDMVRVAYYVRDMASM